MISTSQNGFEGMFTDIQDIKDTISSAISLMNDAEAITAINELSEFIQRIHPIPEPVSCVTWVPAGMVHANEYNPNKVAPPEMKLLQLSIQEDGYTQPIVCFKCEDGTYEVVDGFHRSRVGKECSVIRNRIKGYLPIVVIHKPIEQRMASTIRHNRARGKHGVTPMSEMVATLYQRGWDDAKIAKHLGMDADEVLRLKQITGLPELFADRDYSKSWEDK